MGRQNQMTIEIDLTTTPTIRDGDVVSWYERIGPERAKQLLATYHVDYRKYRPPYSQGLSRDMVNGRWNFDGSPIKIDVAGNLFDGQHRLNAIILSGTTQLFLVVAGLPVEAYNTTDQGLPRKYGDSLRRAGYQNWQARATLVNILARWESGRSLDDSTRFTSPELDKVHDNHVDTITHAIANGMSTASKVDLPQSLVNFSWWVLTNVNPNDAKTFLVGLAEGENLRRGQAVYTLRERLRNDREETYTRNEYMYLVFRAWRAFRENKPIEGIPLPKGFVSRKHLEVSE